MNKLELMQQYLDILKTHFNTAASLYDNYRFAYTQLEKFNIPKESNPLKCVTNLFSDLETHFKNREDIDTFFTRNRPEFYWFCKGKLRGQEVKMYIPMDEEHVLEGSKQLFDFIAREGFEHQSKVAKRMRTDNVVIRVNNIDDSIKISNFVNENQYIQEGLLNVNPFVSSSKGIGYAIDESKSYNETVAKLITNFYKELKAINQENLFTVEELENFVKRQIEKESDLELKDIYILISKNINPNFSITDFYNHVEYKKSNKYSTSSLTPDRYLEEAVKETNLKHPENLPLAIFKYMNGDSTYFTRNNSARMNLTKNVPPGLVISIMRNKLKQAGKQMPTNDEELTKQYVDFISGKSYDSNTDFEIIKNAYISTARIYGRLQADEGFRDLFLNNGIEFFTNKNGNNRDKLKTILTHDIRRIILSNIDINELNVNSINEVLARFLAQLAFIQAEKRNNI